MSKFLRTSIDPKERRILIWTTAVSVLIFLSAFAWIYGPVMFAYWQYQPQEGDILFQSLPRSLLAKVMEDASESNYSHCGIITQQDGQWVVYEAYQKVKATPLLEVIFRGRNYGFAIYRFKPEKQKLISDTIAQAKEHLDKPYDVRYIMDNDEEIYSAELIYNAYRKASGGESLGSLVTLGQLRWKPHRDTIRYFERGPVPVRRLLITPKNLAQAPQLELVSSFRLEMHVPTTNASSATNAKPQ